MNLNTYVMKRGGGEQGWMIDKIRARISRMTFGLDTKFVKVDEVTQKVDELKELAMTADDVEDLISSCAMSLILDHPDYGILAGRIEATRLHRITKKKFSELVTKLFDEDAGFVSDEFYRDVLANAEALDRAIIHARDLDMTYTAFKSMEKAYLITVRGTVVERPQHAYMRVAVAMHGRDVGRILETYKMLSKGLAMHAPPAFFNAGAPQSELNSCYVLDAGSESVGEFYGTLHDAAVANVYAGEVGLSLHDVPVRRANAAQGAIQSGMTNVLRALDSAAMLSEPGGGRCFGAIAAYIEPWHPELLQFLAVKNPWEATPFTSQSLQIGLWICDLFMERVAEDQQWSFFDPADVPHLSELHGSDFRTAYEDCEQRDLAKARKPARFIWGIIARSQIETGAPSMCWKDTINRKSNQRHTGTIKASGLFPGITQIASPACPAVCPSASVVVSKFVEDNRVFDYAGVAGAVRTLVHNLDSIITGARYITKGARISASEHRGIAIGVQGYADALMLMRIPFESDAAREFNKRLFETIYYSALDASTDLAGLYGVYSTWNGSPTSWGILQCEMWGQEPSNMWPFASLREKILQYGLRHSVLTAQMPMKLGCLIADASESVEPYISNLYVAQSIAGQFQTVCRPLIDHLVSLGIWSNSVRDEIILASGSIQEISCIPASVKAIYRTAWEIPCSAIIDAAADRGPFVCQSQALTMYMKEPTIRNLSDLHMYAWCQGLKSSMYRLETQMLANEVLFGISELPPPPPPTAFPNDVDEPTVDTDWTVLY